MIELGELWCPRCQSTAIISRRSLYRLLMREQVLPTAFHWYSEAVPDACPPRSLFALLLFVSVLAAIPAVGLWYLGNYPATTWLAVLALFLLAALLIDALSTYKRYRLWVQQWLCGGCRSVLLLRRDHNHQYRLDVVRS